MTEHVKVVIVEYDAIARTIAHRIAAIIAERRAAGAHAVLGLVREMTASGTTVVMSTHLLLEAEGLEFVGGRASQDARLSPK